MPHKTKREKIIAEYRKRLRLLSPTPVPTLQEKIPEAPPEKKPVIKETDSDISATLYFKKDLKKSLLLIAIVITLEIFLYFATINNYLKLGR